MNSVNVVTSGRSIDQLFQNLKQKGEQAKLKMD